MVTYVHPPLATEPLEPEVSQCGMATMFYFVAQIEDDKYIKALRAAHIERAHLGGNVLSSSHDVGNRSIQSCLVGNAEARIK